VADDDPETCSAFVVDEKFQTFRYAQFRLEIPKEVTGNFNLSLLGSNLGCGNKLHVSLIPAADTSRWTGRWRECRLEATSINENGESCSFQCQSPADCKEIQLMRLPSDVQTDPWTLCHIAFDYILTGKVVYWKGMLSSFVLVLGI